MKSLQYYFNLLELEPGSGKEEIKQAYRKLAQQWHPDKFSTKPEQLQTAREKFELIKEAYEKLNHFAYTDLPLTAPRVAVRQGRATDHYDKGLAYLQQGQHQQAIDSFTQAIRRKPDYLKAYQARAFTLEQLGLHLRAKADFEQVSELQRRSQSTQSAKNNGAASPADADAHFQQGLAQFKDRKYGAAIEYFTAVIRINPNHREAYRYRSQAYFRRGYDDEADKDFKRMRELEQQAKQPGSEPPSPPSATHSATWQCIHTLSRHTAQVSAVAITRDGKKLITGSYDKTLRIWNARTGGLLKTLSDHSDEIHCMAVSWDGKLAASGSADKTIKLWELRTGKLLRSLGNLFIGHADIVTSLAFSPNSQVLVSTSRDQTVRLWDVTSGKESHILKNHTDPILAMAMSWDGKTIAYGGKGTLLNIRHGKTGKAMRSFSVNHQPNQAIALSRQGSLLATGNGATIELWDRHRQKQLCQFNGHAQPIRSLVFSADSQVLVSGSGDKTIKLWDVKTGSTFDTLTGHQSAIQSVAYSLDGQMIMSGSADKTVKIWQQV